MAFLIHRNQLINEILKKISEDNYQVIILEHDTFFERDTGLLKNNKDFIDFFTNFINKKNILEFLVFSYSKTTSTMMQEWKDAQILIPLLDKPVMAKIFFDNNKLLCRRNNNFIQIISNINDFIHNLVNDKIYRNTFENKININLIFNSFTKFMVYALRNGEEQNTTIIVYSDTELKHENVEYALKTIKSFEKENNCLM